MRQIQLTIPNEKLQSIINLLVTDFKLKGIHTLPGVTDTLIVIRTSLARVDEIVNKLNNLGVGITYGIIDILELKATIPPLGEIEREAPDLLTTKTSIEEIYNDIVRNARISVNFIVFNLLAAIVAAMGIIMNNLVIVVSSMILSTLIGPMLGYSYGFVIKDKKLRAESSRCQLIGFAMCWATGFVIGFAYIPYNLFIKAINAPGSFIYELPLDTMYGFTSFEPLIVIASIIIAICAGIAVGFSLTLGSSAVSLVGIAIAATLVPAIVRSGLSISTSLGSLFTSGLILGDYSFFFREVAISLGSLMIFGINLLCIIVTSILVFRIKKVRPPIKTWDSWRGPKLPKRDVVSGEVVEETRGVFGRFWRRVKGVDKQLPPDKVTPGRKITKEEIKEEIKKELKRDISDRIKKEMKAELRKEVKEAVTEELRGEVKNIVMEEMTDGITDEVKEEVTDLVKRSLKKEVKKEIKEEVKDEVTEEVAEAVKDKVKKAVKAEMREEVKEAVKEEVQEKAKKSIQREVKVEVKKAVKEEAKESAKKEAIKAVKKEVKKEVKEEVKKAVEEEVREKTETAASNAQNNKKDK